MLNWFLAAAIAASPPVITVPTGQVVAPNVAAAVTGVSIAESGAGPTVQFTTTVTAKSDLTAAGAVVSGSSTPTLTIQGTSAQTNTALATLAIEETCSYKCQDIITVNTHDASNNTAPQQQIAIWSDDGKYLAFATLAQAQARSATQSQAIGQDGIVLTTNSDTPSGNTLPFASTALIIPNGGPSAVGKPIFGPGIPGNAIIQSLTTTSITFQLAGLNNTFSAGAVTSDIPSGTPIQFGYTAYAWEVDATATGGAVRVNPSPDCLDNVVAPNAVQIVATFSGSITGNVLTAPSSPALRAGLFLGGSGITPVTSIKSGSGTTWLLNKTYASPISAETMNAVTTYCNPAVLPSAGLTANEQSSLVTAPNAGFPAPTVSNGVVTP